MHDDIRQISDRLLMTVTTNGCMRRVKCHVSHLSCVAGKDERRLIRDLFENGYNPLIRPVKNVNDSLQVNFSLALSQIISIVSTS